MKVAFQGIAGSFSYLAAQEAGIADADLIGTHHFREIFEKVDSAVVSKGIVPIENSIAGSIHEVYDLLAKYPVLITAERYLRISHHLLVHRNSTDTSKLRKIFSHAKAFEQCTKYFLQHPEIEQCVMSDTGRAAERVSKSDDYQVAAIGSETAAKIYGLKIAAKNIEDEANNLTRFITIEKELPAITGHKTSILCTLPHTPGSLTRFLQLLSDYKANLTKIESRPVPTKPFEYLFYLDFECEQPIAVVLPQLEKITTSLKILGSYAPARR